MNDDGRLRGAAARHPGAPRPARSHRGRAMSCSAEWAGIAARIREAMDARGLTTGSLSVKTGFPYGTIRSWLACESVPAADKVPAICRAVGASADWILGLAGGGSDGR